MPRPKGSKNQKTEQWEKFSDWFLTQGMKKLESEMNKLEGKDFVMTVKDMLEYFKPKLARTENKIDVSDKVVEAFNFKRNQSKDEK